MGENNNVKKTELDYLTELDLIGRIQGLNDVLYELSDYMEKTHIENISLVMSDYIDLLKNRITLTK